MKIKWLSFLSKDNKQLKAYESWTVRWISLGSYHSSRRQQAQVFTSKEDAELFAKSIKDARNLLKDDSCEVEIEKN